MRATTPRRLPVVLSRAEVAAILDRLDGTAWLVVALLYGAGLRLQEALELRIGRYLFAAAEHAEAQCQLGDRSALARSNQAADELRRLAVEIGSRGGGSVATFSRLLDEDRNGVSGWAAFHLLEVMTAPPEVVNRAFAVIERIAGGRGAEAIGARIRLRELRQRFSRPDPDKLNGRVDR